MMPLNIQLVKRKFEADDSAMRKDQQSSLESSSGEPEYLHTFHGKQDISFRDFLLQISIDQTKREMKCKARLQNPFHTQRGPKKSRFTEYQLVIPSIAYLLASFYNLNSN